MTTPQDLKAERERFEPAYREICPLAPLRRLGDGYAHVPDHIAWLVWQAARRTESAEVQRLRLLVASEYQRGHKAGARWKVAQGGADESAELERVRKDAERYRTLRAERAREDGSDPDCPAMTEDELDAAIDAAMSPSPGGER